jgi:predicted glycosyltransferase
MELAALQKKALLIPTPGQTEQEYLATHLSALGIFYTVSQHTLNLQHDIKNCIEPEKLSQISINNLKAFTSAISVD